jgi:AbrB family looped-hinge helix DNA binding protein
MSQNKPPRYIVTVSSQGQITVPAALRRRLGLQIGDRVEVYPVSREQFVATIRRPPRIMEFAGDLEELDRALRKKGAADPTKP